MIKAAITHGFGKNMSQQDVNCKWKMDIPQLQAL